MMMGELKNKIDAHFGIVSSYNDTLKSEWQAELIYSSPTGVELFTVEIAETTPDNWRFAGISAVASNNRGELRGIHLGRSKDG